MEKQGNDAVYSKPNLNVLWVLCAKTSIFDILIQMHELLSHKQGD